MDSSYIAIVTTTLPFLLCMFMLSKRLVDMYACLVLWYKQIYYIYNYNCIYVRMYSNIL